MHKSLLEQYGKCYHVIADQVSEEGTIYSPFAYLLTQGVKLLKKMLLPRLIMLIKYQVPRVHRMLQ